MISTIVGYMVDTVKKRKVTNNYFVICFISTKCCYELYCNIFSTFTYNIIILEIEIEHENTNIYYNTKINKQCTC